MAGEEYRKKYNSIQDQFQNIEDFVKNSRHAERDNIVETITDLSRLIDDTGEMLSVYEESITEINEREKTLTYAEGEIQTLYDLSGKAPFDSLKAAQSSHRESKAHLEALEERLDKALNVCEKRVSELGKTLATTKVYNPTNRTTDDIDPAAKAELDDILRDVSREGDDWHDR